MKCSSVLVQLLFLLHTLCKYARSNTCWPIYTNIIVLCFCGRYQGVEIDDLEFQRVLFGFFPTYKRSPLPAEWDRVCQIGDARWANSPTQRERHTMEVPSIGASQIATLSNLRRCRHVGQSYHRISVASQITTTQNLRRLGHVRQPRWRCSQEGVRLTSGHSGALPGCSADWPRSMWFGCNAHSSPCSCRGFAFKCADDMSYPQYEKTNANRQSANYQ